MWPATANMNLASSCSFIEHKDAGCSATKWWGCRLRLNWASLRTKELIYLLVMFSLPPFCSQRKLWRSLLRHRRSVRLVWKRWRDGLLRSCRSKETPPPPRCSVDVFQTREATSRTTKAKRRSSLQFKGSVFLQHAQLDSFWSLLKLRETLGSCWKYCRMWSCRFLFKRSRVFTGKIFDFFQDFCTASLQML